MAGTLARGVEDALGRLKRAAEQAYASRAPDVERGEPASGGGAGPETR